jgi:hypothetical protein
MRLPVRRLVLGFAAGAAAGWAAGLLRTPATAPAGSSAGGALRLPQEDFGEPPGDEGRGEEHPPPRKATAPAIHPIPGSEHAIELGEAGGASEPAVTPKPRRRRTPATDPTAAAAEALRAGHAEATEKLTTAADSAPATRRRRKPTGEG